MNRDRSLDEFGSDDVAGASDGESGETDADDVDDAARTTGAPGADVESDPDDTADAADDATPAEPTYAWSSDGAACAVCGETATTRWRQEGTYVCPDCKEW